MGNHSQRTSPRLTRAIRSRSASPWPLWFGNLCFPKLAAVYEKLPCCWVSGSQNICGVGKWGGEGSNGRPGPQIEGCFLRDKRVDTPLDSDGDKLEVRICSALHRQEHLCFWSSEKNNTKPSFPRKYISPCRIQYRYKAHKATVQILVFQTIILSL